MDNLYERKPWEELFQMRQKQGEAIAKACRDIESRGESPTIARVHLKAGWAASRQQIETYMRLTRRID
jgi:hypothetical protein